MPEETEGNTEHPDSATVVDWEFQDTIDQAQRLVDKYNERRAEDYFQRYEQAESWWKKQSTAASNQTIAPPDLKKTIEVDYADSTIKFLKGPELVAPELVAPWDAAPPPPPPEGTVDIGARQMDGVYSAGPNNTATVGQVHKIDGVEYTYIEIERMSVMKFWVRADRMSVFGL